MHLAARPLASVVGLLLLACPRPADAFEVRRRIGSVLRHNTSGRCLKFMHIPKTGGSSIDSHNLHLPKGKRPFHSQMVTVYDKLAELDPLHRDAGQLFDWSHRGSGPYRQFLQENEWAYSWHKMPDDERCHSIHAPPTADARLASYYTERGCSTFCVVREPLQRLVSTAAFTNDFDCAREGAAARFERFVDRALGPSGLFHKSPHRYLCLYLPQVEMVYGAVSKPRARGQYCHRILRQENLTSEFGLLMREYGSSLSLGGGGAPLFSSNGCVLRPGDLPRRTRQLVYRYYEADYLAFGYPKPFV